MMHNAICTGLHYIICLAKEIGPVALQPNPQRSTKFLAHGLNNMGQPALTACPLQLQIFFYKIKNHISDCNSAGQQARQPANKGPPSSELRQPASPLLHIGIAKQNLNAYDFDLVGIPL